MSRAGAFFGEHRRAARAGAFDCQLASAVLPPDDVPDHVHDEAHFVLAIDRGYVSAAFGERPTETPLALVYNPPGTDHRDRFMEAGGRFLGIAFDPALGEGIAAHRPIAVTQGRAGAAACRMAGALTRHAEPLDLEQAALDLIGEVAGWDGEARAPRWLSVARDAIEALAPDDTPSVQAVAAAVGIHPVHLARTYRRAHGHGPATAIQLARLARVAEAMRGNETLAELAAAYGFADQAHLSRSFRQHWGITPGEARAALA